MAELPFGSAGVTATEIDLSFPVPSAPVGVPAGVIGTANEGPAFVPITVGSYQGFSEIFGDTDGEKFGPLAVSAYLRAAQSLSYVRILGIGDGKKRSGSTGRVTNAGFVVGSKIVQDNGLVGQNPHASTARNDEGRTYFLGAFMSASSGYSQWKEAGLTGIHSATGSMGILRGVLLAPSGVILTLSASGIPQGSNQPTNTDVYTRAHGATIQGGMTGSLKIASQEFIMLLNGHKSNTKSNVITASFDVEAANYFGNIFNTDPLAIESKGHLLYARYDIHPTLAVVTGTEVINQGLINKAGSGYEDIAFLLTGSAARNGGSSTVPNYENFEDRFTHAKAPYAISQDFGGTKYNLFRVHSISDGAFTNDLIKLSIENIKPSVSSTDKFGTFDLIVRSFADSDDERRVLEAYRGLTLDRSSDRYIGRVIGDRRVYFDFDQTAASQKLVVAGDHPIKSNYIRVEMSSELNAGQVPDEALPLGHRGYNHLVTSGSHPLANSGHAGMFAVGVATAVGNPLKNVVQPPVPYRETVARGTSLKKNARSNLYWGTQFDMRRSVTQPNKEGLIDQSMYSYVKYFPDFAVSDLNVSVGNNPGVADSAGSILDCDRFNNNLFTLERIKVRTGSDTRADPAEWASASYVRDGSGLGANTTLKTRGLKVSDLKTQGNRKYGKFTYFLQGGFDGSNIFDADKSKFLNAAAKREMEDVANQGGTDGPTVAAYRKGLDILGSKADVDIKLLAVPGARHSSITDYAIDTVESRFDAMYIMDIEERDEINTVITSSLVQTPNVTNTVNSFNDRGLNSSFAAAYFPDLVVVDPTTNTNVQVPPSVSVLGAMGNNDSVGYPWFAPAGFTRGSLPDVIFSKLPLNKANLDTLYDASINPLTQFPGTGLMVYGQKTLLAESSALDRVNVRRLLIDIRRSVRNVSRLMLFEPNRQETLDKFNSLVSPILQSIQERSGVDRYKVIIDATTTTQTDIENNTLRGKIFIQPTRTAEFVALDFVVSNAGNFDGA